MASPQSSREIPFEDDPELRRDALQRILESETFERSTQLRRFLELTVSRTLEGRAEDIKEYTIAVEACGRPASFDPTIDATVRTEARRLRQKLESYYETEGRADPARIVFLKGTYVPTFVANRADAGARGGRPWFAAAAIGVAALVGLVLSLARREETSPAAEPRIAVLPFQMVGGGEEGEGLSLAMSESILTQLTRAGVSVVLRSSALRPRSSPMSRTELAATLDADYLVEGRIERAGPGAPFHLTARLIRTEDEREIWTRSLDFTWTDVFRAQDEFASGLAEALRVARRRGRSRRAAGWRPTKYWTSFTSSWRRAGVGPGSCSPARARGNSSERESISWRAARWCARSTRSSRPSLVPASTSVAR